MNVVLIGVFSTVFPPTTTAMRNVKITRCNIKGMRGEKKCQTSQIDYTQQRKGEKWRQKSYWEVATGQGVSVGPPLLVLTEISNQLLDELPWNLKRTFMFPIEWILLTFPRHHEVDICVFLSAISCQPLDGLLWNLPVTEGPKRINDFVDPLTFPVAASSLMWTDINLLNLSCL